jgi:hypothetical protein
MSAQCLIHSCTMAILKHTSRHFLGLCAAVRGRAGGGCAARSRRLGLSRAAWAQAPRRPPGRAPGAFCLAQSGRLHPFSGTSRAFSPLLPLAHIFSPPPAPPPSLAGLLTSWTKARGRLCPSDVSAPESCGRYSCRRRQAVTRSLAGLPPGV